MHPSSLKSSGCLHVCWEPSSVHAHLRERAALHNSFGIDESRPASPAVRAHWRERGAGARWRGGARALGETGNKGARPTIAGFATICGRVLLAQCTGDALVWLPCGAPVAIPNNIHYMADCAMRHASHESSRRVITEGKREKRKKHRGSETKTTAT